MKPTHRDTKPHPPAHRDQHDRDREDAGDHDAHAGDPERRISATQMAAPSTRRWRRAGRFDRAR